MTALRLAAASAVVAAASLLPAQEAVDMDTCTVCHDETAARFAAGPHGRAMASRSTGTLQQSCATCHGAGQDHVDDPSTDNVTRIPSRDACLHCHGDARAALFLATPAHGRHRVSCLDCHAAGHDDPAADHLLAARPAALCASCHRSEAASFALPFAHRERGQAMACTSCHAVHGAGSVAGARGLLGTSGACIGCHTEKTGPFVFQHPPREIDGCVQCHQPHGSTNPRQLIRRRIMNLCLECHAGVPAFHDLTQARFQACQNCHLAVHGSNRDPRLFEE